jgi:hypothetical protein
VKVQLGIIELQHYGRTLNLHKLFQLVFDVDNRVDHC